MKPNYLEKIAERRPYPGVLLGMDVGRKTIGLALSNPEQSVSTPLETIKRVKFSKDAAVLNQIIAEYDVKGLVIGFPLNMDGSEGKACQSVRDLAFELARILPVLWIAFYDERLSTISVEKLVDKSVEKRKTRIKAKESGLIDKLAAHVILESALESLQKRQEAL